MAINNAVNASQTGFQSQTSTGVWNGRTLTQGAGISITNGDGVSGNPTISASPSPGSLSTVTLYEDFLGSIGGDNSVGSTHLSGSGTSITITYVNSTASNPGIISLNATGSSGSVGFIGTNSILLGQGAITLQWINKIPTLSVAGQRFWIRIGIFDNLTTIAGPANGVWFEYKDDVNSGNYTVNSSSASTKTTNNTTTAADTNFHNFKITVNAAGTSVSFFIDGVEVTGSPITTNITTSNQVTIAMQVATTAGTGTHSLQTDALFFDMTLTTPRPG